jgi:hypothetical protein
MKITKASYTNESNESINACVDGVWMIFPANKSNRFFEALKKEKIKVAKFKKPTVKITLDDVRAKRNEMIAETDYLFLSDGPTPPKGVTKTSLKDYRKALRDITKDLNVSSLKSIDDVVWPTNPLA